MISDDNHFKNLHKKKLVLPETRKASELVKEQSPKEEVTIKKENEPKFEIPDIEDNTNELKSILDKPLD